MRILSLTFVALLLAFTGGLPVSVEGATWRYDFDAAFNEAVQAQKPLLLHFYGEQCPPCRRMEQEVFAIRETLQILETKFVSVKIDAGNPGNVKAGQLVQRFGVHALPTDIILDPLSGRILSQAEGFQDFLRYRTTVLKARTIFDQAHPPAVVQQQPKTEPRPSTPGDVSLGAPQSVVGLDGFSPVSLGAYRKWVPGNPEYAFEFKGMTYFLASQSELDAFRRNPENFAPRLLGCDPVVLFETDRAVPGRTDYGAYFDGDLYLFESDESRRRFKSNPPKFTRIQHVLKVDNIQKLADDSKARGDVN